MKRLLPFVVLILLVIGGLFSIPYLLRPEVQKARLAQSLSKTFRHPVVIGDLSISVLPPTLRLSKLAVTSADGQPFIYVENASAPLSLSGLFKLKAEPEQIELIGWKAVLTRKIDGGWDTREWWPVDQGLAGAKSWTLSRVHLQQGEIRWVDPWAAAPQEMVLSMVEGSWNPRPETLEARGTFSAPVSGINVTLGAKGQFFSQPQWSGDLEWSEQGNSFLAQISRGANGFSVKGQSSKWRLASLTPFFQAFARIPRGPQDAGSLVLEKWQLSAQETSGSIQVEHASLIGGGQSEAKLTLTPGAAGLAAHLEGAVSGVPVEALLAFSGTELGVTGKATGITKSFDVTFSSMTSSTVNGSGYLEIVDGRYRLPETSMKKVAKAKTTAYFHKKFPELDQVGVPLTKASAHWHVRSGQVTIDDGRVHVGSLKAGWVGSLDLPRQGFDGFLRMDFGEKDLKLKALLPAKYHAQPAYGRLQGEWKEWSLRAVPASKVPAPVQAKLRRAL